MKIIIVGAGMVGSSLAEYFARLKHQITIIEQNQALCDSINGKLDVFTVAGSGSSPIALEKAGIKSADMIIAVTPDDETNLLICNFAMQNEVKKRIARVKTNLYVSESSCISIEKLGVTRIIESEWQVAKKIYQYVELPGVLETANFQSDNIYLRGYQVTNDMPIAYKTLVEIREMAKKNPMLFVGIRRKDKTIFPAGTQKLLPGDNILVIMPKESFDVFCSLVNRKITKKKKIIVSGDSLTAIHLSDALKPLCEQVFLVDPNPEHGRKAAAMLDGVEVLEGDTTDSDVLQDIQVQHADYFIAVGQDTEDNIMSCLLAKNEGTKYVIAVRNSDRHAKLFHSLGIDKIINSQDITVSAIIDKIQTVSIGSYLQLTSADIDVIRLQAGKNSAITGRPLRQIEKLVKKSIIIGCIIRQNSVIIPDGETSLEEYDEAIILCGKDQIPTVKKLFNA